MAVELKNSIFIHIPKTGGTWVTQYLTDNYLDTSVISKEFKHNLGMSGVHQAPDMFDTRGKKLFTFVRHPASWYRSFWRYKARLADWYKWHDIEKCAYTDLNKFVNNVLDKFPQGYLTTITKRYTKGATYIGRQENLRYDLFRILEALEEVPINPDYPYHEIQTAEKQNESHGLLREAVFDKDTLHRIMKVESWVIDNFYDIGNYTNN